MEPNYIIILDYNHGNIHVFKLSDAMKVNLFNLQNPELLVGEFCNQLHIGFDECSWMVTEHYNLTEHGL